MQMTLGGGVLIALGAVLWSLGVSPGEVTVPGVIAVSWLIVVSSMLGFTAYTIALQRAPIPAVAAYPYANTIVAVVLGIVFSMRH